MSQPAMQTTPQISNTPSATTVSSSGCRLVAADGRTLPLRGVTLAASARAGVASTVLTQRFSNPWAEPLHITYQLPLPADGAVSGYAFTLGARRIVGEVDKKQAARERFERALFEGRAAGLVEQERSSVFTQELGNIPPGAEVIAELTIDQPLSWLEEGSWEWRFPTALGPRYLGEPGRVADAARIEVAVADRPLEIAVKLALQIEDALAAGARPESPSHALHVLPVRGGAAVELGGENTARLDRDLVVRWRVAAAQVGLAVATGRPAADRTVSEHAYGLITLVPPTREQARPRRRDLILLLDTSGSMGGAPLEQARRVCLALIDTLAPDDRLEMIEFSTAARRWQKGAVEADAKQKEKARAWLKKLSASGGTEMVSGVLEALRPLDGEAQRQIVLLTDGYIGFENEVVRELSTRLPAGSRLHVVGVGSAVNRSLTGPAARAGRGVEVVIGIDEDPERAAKRLCARTAAPLVTEVELSGSAVLGVSPQRLPDLYAGCPAIAAAKLAASGGTITARGRTAEGEWTQTVKVDAIAPGEGLRAAAALFARESVEDLELARAAGALPEAIDAQIERLGIDFQIATRLTTWVAISQEVNVDPTAPTRRERVPQELPHGVSAEGVGLRAVASAPALSGAVAASAASPFGAASSGGAGAVAHASMQRARSLAGPSPEDQSVDELVATESAPGAAPMPSAAAGKPSVSKQAPAPKRGAGLGGVFGKAREVLTSILEPQLDAEETNEAPPPPSATSVWKESESAKAPPAPPSAPAPRVLTAQIRWRKDGLLALELSIDAQLAWTLPALITARLRDGRLVQLEVIAAQSTGAGLLERGQVARLVLRTEEEPLELIVDAQLRLMVVAASARRASTSTSTCRPSAPAIQLRSRSGSPAPSGRCASRCARTRPPATPRRCCKRRSCGSGNWRRAWSSTGRETRSCASPTASRGTSASTRRGGCAPRRSRPRRPGPSANPSSCASSRRRPIRSCAGPSTSAARSCPRSRRWR